MKVFLSLLLVAMAAAAGYVFEPRLRHHFTDETAGNAIASAPSVDLSGYSASQLPEKVTLKAEATVTDPGSDIKMKVAAGSRVTLIRLEGSNVIITPGASPFTGSIPAHLTDLPEQLSKLSSSPASPEPPSQTTGDLLSPNAVQSDPFSPSTHAAPAPATLSPPNEAIYPPPTEDSVSQPSPPVETPPVTPIPLPDPEPLYPANSPGAPPASPRLAPATETELTPVVIAMKASLKEGEVTEFTYDQVKEWSTGEDETIKGKTYQTGLVTCETFTSFGTNRMRAKAYVLDGKVIRWVWPQSGLKIK